MKVPLRVACELKYAEDDAASGRLVRLTEEIDVRGITLASPTRTSLLRVQVALTLPNGTRLSSKAEIVAKQDEETSHRIAFVTLDDEMREAIETYISERLAD